MLAEQQLPVPDFQRLPLVGRVARKFDSLVGEMGLQDASREVVRQTRTKFEVLGMTAELQQVLQHSPCLIVCNHRFDLEHVSLLAALPSRPDTYVVAAHNQKGFGRHVADHIIPVYVWGKHEAGDVKMSVRIARRLNLHPVLTGDEAHARNVESISHAARQISEGHQVIMFPEGPGGKTGKWQTGIGYLLKEVNNQDAVLVFANVSGTSDSDFLRLFPGASVVLPTIHVMFFQPVLIRDLVQELSPRDITQRVRKTYLDAFQTKSS